MTAIDPAQLARADRSRLGRAWLRGAAASMLGGIVAVWMFSGGFVIVEPSPYEVFFLVAFAVALFGGLRLHRDMLPVLYITLFFTPFALIAAFQGKYLGIEQALIFNLVTVFLMITSYFAGNYVAQTPYKTMRLMILAYTAAALITASTGFLAYIGVLPGEDVFLRFRRAKAFFNDPNVYGPFLVLPAAFALQRILLGRGRTVMIAAAIYMLLFIGILVSFSRGAWGHLIATSGLVYLLCFFLEAKARDKVRMLLMGLGGVMVLAVVLLGLLSIPAIADLFIHRFALTQSYDTGETGRFGRIGYALEIALTHPWGLGPLEFPNLRIIEQPHNTYINVLLTYGWGGALAFYILIAWTFGRGVSMLANPSPNRLLLIPVFSTFLPMVMLSGIIDTDHWRHWFLVVGMLWGITAGYRTLTPMQAGGRRVLP